MVISFGDMTADTGRGCYDRIAGLAGRHKGIEIGQGTGPYADLGKTRLEHLGDQGGGDHLNLFDGLQPHFVFVARITQRRARPERWRVKMLALRVWAASGHHGGVSNWVMEGPC